MDKEDFARQIADGEHTEIVATIRVHIPEVVNDVAGQECGADENGDAQKEVSQHSEEAQVGNRIQAERFNEVIFLGAKDGTEPREEASRYGWWFLALWRIFSGFGVQSQLEASLSAPGLLGLTTWVHTPF